MNDATSIKYMLDSAFDAEIVLSGKKYLNFSGCGYLGMQGNSEAIAHGCEAYHRYGTSAGGLGRAYSACSYPTLDVEDKAASFFGSETAVYFASGYLVGMVGLAGLQERFDLIFLDDTAHFSLKDAAVLTTKPFFTFAHCDAEDLSHQIKKNIKPGQRPLVMSDGVFPTFGELAPVAAYLEVVESYDGIIFLDEAHSAGVTGPNGRGSFDHHHLKSDRIYFGATLSKAFGSHGAVIPCSREQLKLIRQESNVLRGATSPAIPCAAHAAKSLGIVKKHPEIRLKLAHNTRQLKDAVRDMGFDMNKTEVPIVTIGLGSEKRNRDLHKALLAMGIFTTHSHYIGSGDGGALRHSVMATHTPEQIKMLISALRELV